MKLVRVERGEKIAEPSREWGSANSLGGCCCQLELDVFQVSRVGEPLLGTATKCREEDIGYSTYRSTAELGMRNVRV